MTPLLQELVEEASRLSPSDQNAVARRWIEELEAGERWDEAFANSRDVLDMLTAEAIEDDRRSRRRLLDVEVLDSSRGR